LGLSGRKNTNESPNPLVAWWPEAEMRTGDFSKLNEQGQPITIYDPFDYSMDSSGNPVRNPFPGNRIPATRINPIAAAVTKCKPASNRAAPAGSEMRAPNAPCGMPNL
jgi:hypothetical protein